MIPTSDTSSRRVFLRVAVALLLAVSGTRIAAAQVINEPPLLPVSIVAFTSHDGMEAHGFTDGRPVDISVIRNGVVVGSIVGALSHGGVLDVNAPGGVCWVGVTPDIRPGDIVRYAEQGGPINQVHVMPLTISRPVQTAPGVIEIHGTASDLNGLPIPLANIDQRVKAKGLFSNGRTTLRAGAINTDGTFTYDTVDNPTGTKWTVRYAGLTAADVANALSADMRVRWLGVVPANANQLTIVSNDPATIPGPFVAGGCTAPLEPLDVTPPTAPTALTSAVVGPSSLSFTWGPSTDNVVVAGYELLRDGVAVARLGPLATSATDVGIPAGPHVYTVVAFDNASPLGAGATPSAQIAAGFGQPWGNRSAPSNAIAFTQADVVPPTTPATFTVPTGNGKAMPTWSPSTDNVGVVSYGLYRNNVLIATIPSPTTTYKDSGLVTGTYNYSVDAVDAVNLRSARTANVAANVVFIPDTTPPTVPAPVSGGVSPDLHGRDAVISWGAASDSMGVTGYTLYRNGVSLAVLGPNTLTFRDAALATATYVYQVDAFDAANNHSAKSAGLTAVIANDPPSAGHVLIAHPSRDWVSATGYPDAAGPYTFTLIRGATVFTSIPSTPDGTGTVQVNRGGGGACWNGVTPDLRAGDVVRITDANGFAEQTTVADVTTQFAIATGAATVVVHGTAQTAAGAPLPLARLEQRLVAAAGTFDANGTATLRASAAAGADGSLTYDAPGSTHWTATYAGLSAADVARATGGPANAAAESRGLWLGRDALAGTEQSMFETGPGVNGGPLAGLCVTPAEAPVPTATFSPASLNYGDVLAIPAFTSGVQTATFQNTGAVTMTIHSVYLAGANTADFNITSPPAPTTLAPGATLFVDVTFAPKAVGARQAMLCLSCDAANTTALSVALTGNGISDTTPPTVPASVNAVVSPDLHGRDAVVLWSAATDSTGVTGYTVYRDGVAIATVAPATLAYHDVGLAPATHVYRVDAFDAANNHSAQSAGASVLIANDPPTAGHVLVAHPSRDWVSGTGYPAAQGPYVITVFRGNRLFTSMSLDADGAGLVQVNHAGGGCWSGITPNLRAGDVVRITDANGLADQTTVADIMAELPVAIDSATVVVHGTARITGSQPLPVDQIENRLVAASGTFAANGTATLSARAAAGADGTLAYDAPGSTHWTATYAGLSAADVARATGGTNTAAGTLDGAESQGAWLGRSPAAGTELTLAEAGPSVVGGPGVPQCAAPAESPAAAASFMPSAIVFDRQGVVPASTSQARAILFRNTGDAPMNIGDVRVTGLNAGEFPIVSSDAPAVLAPGAYCTVKVAFSPSALGARQAALSFACDAVNSPTVSTPLAGTGWSGLVIASPSGPVPEIGVGTLLTPLAGNPTQGTIPVSIHWDASSTPQADHYDLQQSVNGGPFVDTAVQPGAATAVTMDLPLSSAGNPAAYLFRVRASGAGEMSNWVTGRVFAAEPVDDTNNSRVAFSGAWAPSVLAGAWGGGTRVTSARCSAELRAGAVFGSLGSIAWITTMGPDRGMVFVTVDDKDSVAVDLYAPTLQVGVVGFVATNLAAGHSHRMLIRTRALKNPLAVGVRVDADAFVVVKVPAPTAVVETNRLPGGLMSQATDLPEALSFSPIVPNPVVDRATLAFGLPRDGAVRLDVMDVQGRLVRRLADGFLPAGVHQIAWDGRGSASQAAHSGVYFAVLRFGEQTLVRRIVWMP